MTDYSIETEQEVDGRWIAEITKISGCLAYGKTKQEAVENVLKLADTIAVNQGFTEIQSINDIPSFTDEEGEVVFWDNHSLSSGLFDRDNHTPLDEEAEQCK